jgi:ribosome-associated translation inhibitor RaiA
MSELREKLREGLNISGGDSDLREQLKRYNIVKRVNQIEEWIKQFGEPNIKSNLSDIRNIYTDIRNNIKPDIDNAVSWARDAIGKAQNLVNKVKKAGEDLGADAQEIETAGRELWSEIIRIMANIRQRMINFGENIKDSAQTNVVAYARRVKNAVYDAAGELTEAYNEIRVPTERVSHYKDLLWRDRYNLVAVAYNAFYALGHLTFFNHNGQGGCLEEIIEAFDEIGGGFSNLGNEFRIFANHFNQFAVHLKAYARRMALKIEDDLEELQGALTTFFSKIRNMGINLSNNLK